MTEPRPSTSHPVTPRPSSAVVVARERAVGGFEVFMVRRHIKSEFVPDAFVFPGGSVKLQDAETEQAAGACAPVPDGPTALGTGYRAAALRECFEEAGVLLARQGGQPLAIPPADAPRFAVYAEALRADQITLAAIAERERLVLATDELLHWAHWITPEPMPKRFTTHFFLAPMPPVQEAAHDQIETSDGVWITPRAALAGAERGDFPLVFATIHQLRELATLASLAAARERYAGIQPHTIQPRIERRDGRDVIVHPDEL
jgi:8-oxo-dGTP pyrophosphatase MutT (NUDIX family)